MDSKLLSASEVKDQYGISRTSLLRYEEDGKLQPNYTPGGHRRYKTADLDNLLSGESLPNVPDSQEQQQLYQEWGTTLKKDRWVTQHEGYGEFLRELKGSNGRKILREMKLNDPVISAIFFAVHGALQQASWRVSPASERPPDKMAKDLIETSLNDMSFTLRDTLSFIYTFLEDGFSTLEIVYKKRLGENPPMYVEDPATSVYGDGMIGWRKWSPRPPDTLVEGEEFLLDSHGGIMGIQQEIRTGEVRKIHISKLLHFRTTVNPANNPYGLPIHRSMYVPWWYSQGIQEIEGIGIERDLAGLPVVYLGTGTTKVGTNNDYQKSLELVNSIRNDEQAGVVIPHPKLGTGSEGAGVLLELLSSGGRRQHDTDSIINRYNKQKAMAVLAQFIMLGMEKVGSYALSSHQGDLFTLAVSAWLYDIADVINRHAIPKLIRYNGIGGLSGMPTIVPGTIGLPDLGTTAEFVNKLVQQEVITPDIELERHLRQLGGMPDIKPIELTDEEGNPIPGGLGRQNISLEKSALLTRRVGLAADSLLKVGAIDEGRAAAILEPLVTELEEGIQSEIVMGQRFSSVRRPRIKPTSRETDEEEGNETEGDEE